MPKFRIEPAACILAAVTILILPLNWLLAAFTAAVIHELFHWAAIRLRGGRVYSLAIRPGGAVMETSPMEKWDTVLCTAAGPAGSLILLLFVHQFPRFALCGAMQGLFNLLPIYPLDGGRILCALMDKQVR